MLMTNQVQQCVYEACKSTHSFMVKMRNMGGVGEESITDKLLCEINARLSDVFITWKHNKLLEGRKTGADWELWIIYDNHYFCFHIQAKKFSDSLADKQSVFYKNGEQYHLLLNDANKYGAIPLYVYYVANIGNLSLRCGNFSDSGVYYEDARNMNRYFSDDKYKNQSGIVHLRYTNPLPCLLCNIDPICNGLGSHIEIIETLDVPSYVNYLKDGKDINSIPLPNGERERISLFNNIALMKL